MSKRLRSKLQRVALQLKHRAAYSLGLLGLAIGIATMQSSTLGGLLLALTGLAVGGFGAVLDWRGLSSSMQSVHIRPATAREVRGVGVPQNLLHAGYQVQRIGRGPETAAVSPVINQALRHGWDPPVFRSAPKRQSAVSDQDAYAILDDVARGGTVLTNDPKVALCSDLLSPTLEMPAAIARTRYFDGVVSNDMFMRQITREGHVVLSGRDLCTTRGCLDLLSESRASNHIGVSVLALTWDGLLVLSEQGSRSAQEPQRLAPTGSGSVDWKDTKDARTLLDICRRAAVREFVEETSIAITEADLLPIGFSRLIFRGGKPEFFFLVRLNAAKGDFRVIAGEHGLTAGHEFFRLEGSNAQEAGTSLRRLLRELDGRLSTVLTLALSLLSEHLLLEQEQAESC